MCQTAGSKLRDHREDHLTIKFTHSLVAKPFIFSMVMMDISRVLFKKLSKVLAILLQAFLYL